MTLQPSKLARWKYELSARKKGSICAQYLMQSTANGDMIIGCENCLYMNIYVSIRDNNNNLLSIIFWIHGRAFQFGNGNHVDERRLMDRDIVFVSFNYRVEHESCNAKCFTSIRVIIYSRAKLNCFDHLLCFDWKYKCFLKISRLIQFF